MAKRSRRARKEAKSSSANMASSPNIATPVSVTNTSTPSTKQDDYAHFALDYDYVFKDIRTILLITILMIGLMVALSFVI